MDGIDLRTALAGENLLPVRSLFWHYPHYNDHPSSVPSSVIRTEPWKLIETFDSEGLELYNLAANLPDTALLSKSRRDTAIHGDGRCAAADGFRNGVLARMALKLS